MKLIYLYHLASADMFRSGCMRRTYLSWDRYRVLGLQCELIAVQVPYCTVFKAEDWCPARWRHSHSQTIQQLPSCHIYSYCTIIWLTECYSCMWFFHFLVSEPVSFSLGTIVDRIQCILSTMLGHMTALLAVSFVTIRYFTVGLNCYYSINLWRSLQA